MSEGRNNTLGFALGTVSGVGGLTGLFAMDQFQSLNSYEQSGLVTGAAQGAAIGSMVAPGIGTVIGAGVGALGGFLMGRSQGRAAEEEAAAREQARVDAVMREFGIMQQRSNMIASRARNARTPQGQGQSPGSATQALNESGFIGQNMINTGGTVPSSSGTF